MTKELNRTWLVQRLTKPYKGEGIFKDNPFSFGGGLKNGGLSEDAMKLLRPIFEFDYMGSAEFEFGAIPAFFKNIAAEIKEYELSEIKINKTPVYIIGKKSDMDQIKDRVKHLSKHAYGYKETPGLDQAVGFNERIKKEDCRYKGWLELDNEFMFFVDKEMFDKTAELFGLKSL